MRSLITDLLLFRALYRFFLYRSLNEGGWLKCLRFLGHRIAYSLHNALLVHLYSGRKVYGLICAWIKGLVDTLTLNEILSPISILLHISWSSIESGILHWNNLMVQYIVISAHCTAMFIRIHFLVWLIVLGRGITLDNIKSAGVASASRVRSRPWGINIDVFHLANPSNN